MAHHYDELWPGRFRKGTTLAQPMTIRIVSLGGEQLEGDDGVKSKGVLRYRAKGADGGVVEEEIVFCKTNAILTAAILGTPDYTEWPGHLITIHFDPSVAIGKDRVGGIRVFGSPELKKTIKVDVKRPRRKKPETYVLQPTDNAGRVRQAATSTSTPSTPPPMDPNFGAPSPAVDPDAPDAEREEMAP